MFLDKLFELFKNKIVKRKFKIGDVVEFKHLSKYFNDKYKIYDYWERCKLLSEENINKEFKIIYIKNNYCTIVYWDNYNFRHTIDIEYYKIRLVKPPTPKERVMKRLAEN